MLSSEEMVKKIAQILDSKKAININAIDIRGLTTIGDYFIVASGSSTTQVKALADEVETELSKLGIKPKSIGGYQSAIWILLDYYEVIVHIFYEDTRNFYSLERLWADAPKVDLSDVLKA